MHQENLVHFVTLPVNDKECYLHNEVKRGFTSLRRCIGATHEEKIYFCPDEFNVDIKFNILRIK